MIYICSPSADQTNKGYALRIHAAYSKFFQACFIIDRRSEYNPDYYYFVANRFVIVTQNASVQ